MPPLGTTPRDHWFTDYITWDQPAGDDDATDRALDAHLDDILGVIR